MDPNATANMTDDEVVARMNTIVSAIGTDWAENYDMFLSENRTFDGYWPDGVDAIRDNAVHLLVFGRDCLLETGRAREAFPDPADIAEQKVLLMDLAIAMSHKVDEMVRMKPKSPSN